MDDDQVGQRESSDETMQPPRAFEVREYYDEAGHHITGRYWINGDRPDFMGHAKGMIDLGELFQDPKFRGKIQTGQFTVELPAPDVEGAFAMIDEAVNLAWPALREQAEEHLLAQYRVQPQNQRIQLAGAGIDLDALRRAAGGNTDGLGRSTDR